MARPRGAAPNVKAELVSASFFEVLKQVQDDRGSWD